jgi:hypothetical protein
MLNEFLDMLGVDTSDEILSEIDPITDNDSSHFQSDDELPDLDTPSVPNEKAESSSDTEPDLAEVPVVQLLPVLEQLDATEVQSNDPIIQFDYELTSEERKRVNFINTFVDNLHISKQEKHLLRKYYRQKVLTSASASAVRDSQYLKLNELAQLIKSSDSNIRRKAEYELGKILDQLKIALPKSQQESANMELSSDDDDEILNSDHESSVETHNSAPLSEPASVSNHSDNLDMPDLEWDHAGPLGETPPRQLIDVTGHWLATPYQRPAQNVQIRLPNAEINIRPDLRPSTSRQMPGTSRGPPTSTPRVAPRQSGVENQDVQDWLSTVSPHFSADNDDEEIPSPVVTRSGRTSKPPVRYDAKQEIEKQKELRDVVRTLDRSKSDLRPKSSKSTKPAVTIAEPEQARSSSVQSKVPRTSKKSVSSQKTKSTKK